MTGFPESPRPPQSGWRVALLTFLTLLWLGCPAREQPLSPAAAAFKRDLRETIARLTAVLMEPVCQADARACEEAILSIYPQAPRDTLTFPFHVGVMNRDGVLIYTIPPVKNLGADYSQYQAVRDALRERRIRNVRLFAPNGRELYLILAPMLKDRRLVGLLLLRLDPERVAQRWGLSTEEFLAVNLN